MYIPSILLIVATVGEAAMGTDVIDLGSKLANLGAVGILGVVSVCSVVALVRIYRDKQNETKETITMLHDTIKENTSALQSLKDFCTNKK